MAIRNKEQLITSLNNDSSWRKKELTILSNNVKSAKNEKLKTALRAGIVLLYAHWEGFIKTSAESYLIFVSDQAKQHKLKYKEVQNCFVALCLKQKITSFTQTNKATVHCQVLDFIDSYPDERINIPCEGIISTQSNLNSDVLKEILTCIGLDFSPFELKSNLIDAQLLNFRNSIAHGQYLPINEDTFEELYKEILSIMYAIETNIANNATREKYRK